MTTLTTVLRLQLSDVVVLRTHHRLLSVHSAATRRFRFANYYGADATVSGTFTQSIYSTRGCYQVGDTERRHGKYASNRAAKPPRKRNDGISRAAYSGSLLTKGAPSQSGNTSPRITTHAAFTRRIRGRAVEAWTSERAAPAARVPRSSGFSPSRISGTRRQVTVVDDSHHPTENRCAAGYGPSAATTKIDV